MNMPVTQPVVPAVRDAGVGGEAGQRGCGSATLLPAAWNDVPINGELVHQWSRGRPSSPPRPLPNSVAAGRTRGLEREQEQHHVGGAMTPIVTYPMHPGGAAAERGLRRPLGAPAW